MELGVKNEAEFKSLFKKSVRAQKGFSLSLAAPMVVGIPDLFVVMPGYMAILLEAKWLGEIKRDNFSRKLLFTPMQINWIETSHKVNPYTAMGLIGFVYKENIHACFVAYDTPLFSQFDNTFLTNCSYSIRCQQTKLFDVSAMFAKVPIPKLCISDVYVTKLYELSNVGMTANNYEEIHGNDTDY